jgi:hypothetical protein
MLLLLLLVVGLCASKVASQTVMVWMCLERCFNTTSEQVQEHVQLLQQHSATVDSVAFEQFNLGPNSTLLDNPSLSSVALQLRASGFKTFAMVSSWPYPPDFIFWLRELFSNPVPFTTQCIAAASQFNLTGFNLDFEPAVGVTEADALAYAAFLSNYTSAMHQHGVLVTADIAGWSPLWNLTALNATPVDKFFYMGTYARNFTTFSKQLAKVTSAISADKLAIGLQNYGANETDVVGDPAQRFDAIANYQAIKSVGIWVMPLNADWFAAVAAWKRARVPCESDSQCRGQQRCNAEQKVCECAFGAASDDGRCVSVELLESPVAVIFLALACVGCAACVLICLWHIVKAKRGAKQSSTRFVRLN